MALLQSSLALPYSNWPTTDQPRNLAKSVTVE